MSCPLRIAYSPIICSALPIQSESHFHYVDPQSPEKHVDPQLPEKARCGSFSRARCGKDVARGGEGKDRSFAIVFAKCFDPNKIAPELESERPRRPTLAGKDCKDQKRKVSVVKLPFKFPLDLQKQIMKT